MRIKDSATTACSVSVLKIQEASLEDGIPMQEQTNGIRIKLRPQKQ